ncbi:MAG TPA: YHS domain-containing (seleno)protein [Candidatus Methylacidiphilales bacterium]|nr:YHS domain-containing (seleno)protein [Candidatus Methylacidiphilales bacterium]
MKHLPLHRSIANLLFALTALFALAGLLPVSASAGTLTKQLVNVDKNGVALQGYDPVGFYTEGKPVKGLATISSQYKGATYHFASKANRASFNSKPGKYEPMYGGFCAFGVCKGKMAAVDVSAFKIMDGRLMMMHDAKARAAFDQDAERNRELADRRWRGFSFGNGGTIQ